MNQGSSTLGFPPPSRTFLVVVSCHSEVYLVRKDLLEARYGRCCCSPCGLLDTHERSVAASNPVRPTPFRGHVQDVILERVPEGPTARERSIGCFLASSSSRTTESGAHGAHAIHP